MSIATSIILVFLRFCSLIKNILNISQASSVLPAAKIVGKFKLIEVIKPAIIGGIA
ncbi:hypothetical protein [Clostridium sp.]|uniref:hypothetical protein n=1 Tax=Clostridium sp. TaxID=1506 RepID=UPI001A4769E7|nr:hypothetical protein [Clostridium sp.]MBK5242961.1 hypothetical protein [Clostridium sp.]